MALRLAEHGATVVLTDARGLAAIGDEGVDRAVLLEQAVRDGEAAGARAVADQLDVAQQDDMLRCVSGIDGAQGQVDILVNNAGSLAASDAFLHTTPAPWQANSVAVNLLGPLRLAQAVIPGMKRAAGASSTLAPPACPPRGLERSRSIAGVPWRL